MDPILTLYEHITAPIDTLPPVLAQHYGGGLLIPEGGENELPYVIANFVETLDGVVSYNAPGQTGGGVISGGNPQDKMVMGLVRACADAVIFGSSSLQVDANHPRIPSFISPTFAHEYAALRLQLKRQERYPISVIMTASGQIDLNDKTFHTPDLKAIIATTTHGAAHLAQQTIPEGTDVRIIAASEDTTTKETVSPQKVVALLAREYGVRVVLYEGGPTLLASFLAERQVNELFLTVAPQLAGQINALPRLPLVAGHAFAPSDAPWMTLLSVKLAGSHLLLRYKFT